MATSSSHAATGAGLGTPRVDDAVGGQAIMPESPDRLRLSPSSPRRCMAVSISAWWRLASHAGNPVEVARKVSGHRLTPVVLAERIFGLGVLRDEVAPP